MLRHWAVALLVLLPPAAGLAQTGGEKLEIVLKVEDKLTKDDPKDKKTQTFSKIHLVNLVGGTNYVITMVSKDVDSVLRIENKEGKELGYDDDSAGYPNPLIGFKCPKDDEYKIICTSFVAPSSKYKNVGDYTLTIRKATEADLKKYFPGGQLLQSAGANAVREYRLQARKPER